ncbi:hypothetical protein [Halocynthiibacter namhaensis]|uniref:hypothetical protein n=1 Tax=Halocynthiibacter namhaensis TaxID=1290553 RepID=UPI0012E02E80|nr:hypothetical protein [Halocynthiibacter namhaensis]
MIGLIGIAGLLYSGVALSMFWDLETDSQTDPDEGGGNAGGGRMAQVRSKGRTETMC